MKNRISLISIVILCVFLILVTTGCWSRKELNNLAIVTGVGLDKSPKNGQIELTAQLIKPKEMKSAKKDDSGGGGTKAYWNIKDTGDSVFNILRGFTHVSSRKLFFPDNQVLIFGRDLAKEGMQKSIDFFVRDHETRLTVLVLVTMAKAGDVLDVSPEMDTIPAKNIAQLVKTQAATSESCMVNLEQFITRLMSKTTAPIAPLVEISDDEKEKTVHVSGTAVFKNDKLVGQLNKSETRGLLWGIDEIKNGIIEVESPNGDGIVSLEITRATSKITPELIDGKIHIKIAIYEEGNIGSQSNPENLALPPIWAVLEKEQSAVIESEVMFALQKAKQLNADIFGFGDAVHQRYPKEWKDLEPRWNEIFPDIEVELAIYAKLFRTGRIISPAGQEQE